MITDYFDYQFMIFILVLTHATYMSYYLIQIILGFYIVTKYIFKLYLMNLKCLQEYII